jgi:hypothetical protein
MLELPVKTMSSIGLLVFGDLEEPEIAVRHEPKERRRRDEKHRN